MVVLVEIFAKKDKFGYVKFCEPHFGEVKGDARPWLMAHWNAHGDFLFALIESFSSSVRFRSYEAKCVQLGCFHRGSTSLSSNFTWTGSSPINHSEGIIHSSEHLCITV